MKDIYVQSFPIIGARPKKMPYEEYRERRRENAKALKRRLRGVCVWEIARLAPGPDGKPIVIRTKNPSYCRAIHGELPRVVVSL